MENRELASKILELVGGEQNVAHATFCMTRLRLNLKDRGLLKDEAINQLDGVIGTRFLGTQYQIIIGPKVNKVYAEFVSFANLEYIGEVDVNSGEVIEKEKITIKNILGKILDGIAGCMTPLLPVLIVAGLVKMLVAILGPDMLKLFNETSDIYRTLNLLADTCFYFLPVFAAYSTAEKFKCNKILAVLLGCVMVSPSLISIVEEGNSFTVFGIPMTVAAYNSTVFPSIMSVAVMSFVEKYLKRWLPDTLQSTVVPLLTMLIMLPVCLCVLGPLGSIIGIYLGKGLIALHDLFGPLGVAVVGCLFMFIVATGMHLALFTTALASIAELGYDNFILAGGMITVYGMIAAALYIIWKAKDRSLREFAVTGLVSQAIGGVGEPLLFGILFRFKKVLGAVMVGAFCGSLVIGITGAGLTYVPTSNLLTFTAYSINSQSIIFAGIAGLVTFTVTFVILLFIGYDSNEKK